VVLEYVDVKDEWRVGHVGPTEVDKGADHLASLSTLIHQATKASVDKGADHLASLST